MSNQEPIHNNPTFTNSHQPAHESPVHPPKSDEQERNALRAYLARAEVRLSTMHRVAVGFISGAGLLLLLPIFFKDATLSIVRALLNYTPTLPPTAGTGGVVLLVILYLFLMFPFLLSMSIPVIALILLIKDIVRFYFTGHAPGFPDDFFNPRFALSGVAFSPDESESAKARIMIHQYGSNLINFILPHDEKKSEYFSGLIDKPRRMIIPTTRKLPRLIYQDIAEIPSGKSLDTLEDNDVIRIKSLHHGTHGDLHILPENYKDRTVKEIDRFNAALGLAGFLERPLYEEAAKSEVSLVRHAINLRRLVLRYAQALLIFLWTMGIAFAILPFLELPKRFPTLTIFAVGYLIWSLFTPFVVGLPVYWLVRLSHRPRRSAALRELRKHDDLEYFENKVRLACYFAVITSVLAVGLSVWLNFV
jgi:hypothetical protein